MPSQLLFKSALECTFQDISSLPCLSLVLMKTCFKYSWGLLKGLLGNMFHFFIAQMQVSPWDRNRSPLVFVQFETGSMFGDGLIPNTPKLEFQKKHMCGCFG